MVYQVRTKRKNSGSEVSTTLFHLLVNCDQVWTLNGLNSFHLFGNFVEHKLDIESIYLENQNDLSTYNDLTYIVPKLLQQLPPGV